MPPQEIPTAFTRLVGCRLPLQLAGMGGAPSADLAIAVSEAGGFGMLSGAVGADALAVQLDAVPASLPMGVNFIVPFLQPKALEIAAERAGLVEFFWATPDPALVARVSPSARVAWHVGSSDDVSAALDAGCDAVVLQGVDAGGHVLGTGPWRALLDEVRGRTDAPLIVGGGIGTAADVAAALAAGADGVRLGTRFLAATESVAHDAYVDQLIAADADDTVLTTAFGLGWPDAPHRVLKSCLRAGEANGGKQMWTPEWPTTDYVGDALSRALYAGTSVAAVTQRQPAAEIVAELFGG